MSSGSRQPRDWIYELLAALILLGVATPFVYAKWLARDIRQPCSYLAEVPPEGCEKDLREKKIEALEESLRTR